MIPIAWITAAVLALVATCAAALRWTERRRFNQRLDKLAALWNETPEARRAETFRQKLRARGQAPDADTPAADRHRAEFALLAGFAHLNDRAPADAARMFQIAAHADPRFRSAVLLVFACLKARDDSMDRFDKLLHETWIEIGSPTLGRTKRERSLWDVANFQPPTP
jgi:hypothetical protein